jgi:hypothetical protein
VRALCVPFPQTVHLKYGMMKPVNGMPSFGISEWVSNLGLLARASMPAYSSTSSP